MSGFARRLQQGAGIVVLPTAPFPPAEPSITAGNASVTVFWAAPASDGGSPITGYTVTVNPGSHTANTNGSTFSSVVSGLTNGTSYTAAVTATNAIGSTTSASSNPVTPSASSPEYPDATTTGITGAGLVLANLTPSGSITISANNTTVDKMDVTGSIKVMPGVTGTVIQNSRITTSGGTYCINCQYSGTAGPVVIQDCEIISTPTTDTSACINISKGSSILRCDISGSKQSVNGGMANVTMQDNYMHDLVNVSGSAHCENIFVGSCTGGLQIIHNRLDNPLTQTATVFLQTTFGSLNDILVQDNLVAGGGYCFYGGAPSGSYTTTNVRFLANRYRRNPPDGTAFWANGGNFGTKAYMATGSDPSNQYSGNIWDDDGTAA